MKRPGLFVGVLAIAAIAYITFNSARTEGPGSRGVEAGSDLPAFAAPLALSRLDGDANLSDRACRVRGPDILNSCELAERGPVVLGFFAEPADRCEDLDRVLLQHPPGIGRTLAAVDLSQQRSADLGLELGHLLRDRRRRERERVRGARERAAPDDLHERLQPRQVHGRNIGADREKPLRNRANCR